MWTRAAATVGCARRAVSSLPLHGRVASSVSACGTRTYHSYPDPSEVPVITTSINEVQKTAQKPPEEFKEIEGKFRMDQILPGVPPNTAASRLEVPSTKVTVLENGLTVGSQEMYGMLSSIGVIVAHGSSYEKQPSECGLTHMTEVMAFKATQKRTHEQLATDLERIGAMAQCFSTPETTMYCIDVMRQEVPAAMDILAESILQPRLTDEELENARAIIEFQSQQLPASILSRNAVTRAAYQGSPLGNHHLCPQETSGLITIDQLQAFRSRGLFGSNAVLSGAGVAHGEFVDLAKARFSDLPSKPAELFTRQPSVYVGGEIREQRELQEPYVRLAVGMEIGGWHDDMLVPVCVLQSLLGGGSSFSAGGPGKGIYTRLYQELLNKHYWIEAAEAFVSIYSGTGLLGIDGAAKAEYIPYLLRVFLEQLAVLSMTPVTDIELSRAKNMLKSLVLTQLESRLVMCEDISRQLLEYKRRESPQAMCAKIDRVTAADLMDVVREMFKKPPSIGCVGYDVSKLPEYSQVLQWFGR